MSDLEHDNDVSLADFTAGWRSVEESEQVTVMGAVIGLTNFGERPVPSVRLAEVLGRSLSEAEALARQWGWPGTRVEDGFISVNPERARSPSRRRVQIGERRFGVTGCAPDIFIYAPLVRPSLVLEETCTTTGTHIRIVFAPSRVESADPSTTVVPMPPPRASTTALARNQNIDDIDANL
jgi:hypothetical protein